MKNKITVREQIVQIKDKCKIIKPTVVINCLTYNHESFIRDALDGFILQNTNFPFVAIVHDDASTDGTADIIREYAEKYPTVILPIYEIENQYSKRDGSHQKIMNEACEVTGAKYIAMCEGDDYWTDPLKLQKQIEFLETHPDYGLCCTECDILENHIGKISHKKWTFRNIITFENLMDEGNQITTLTVLYRRELINGYNELNKPKWPLGDYPLWLYITSQKPAYKLSDISAVYRVLQESASHSKDIQKNFLFAVAMQEIRIFFSKYKNKNSLRYNIARLKIIVKFIFLYPRYLISFLPYIFKIAFK